MHLHYRHDPQVDVRAFIASQELREIIPPRISAGMQPDEAIALIVAALCPDAIGGYSVDIGPQLRAYVAPLLASPDSEVRSEAVNELIDYAAIQASCRDFGKISDARAKLGNELAAISYLNALPRAS